MEVLILIVIVGLIAAVCAHIHDSRGHSAVGGFMWGLGLGLIGLIVVLRIPKSQEKLERRQLAGGKVKKCPACLALVPREAAKCSHCASRFALARREQIVPIA